jgi:uncharacterized protein YjbI with pentapeptide repeats
LSCSMWYPEENERSLSWMFNHCTEEALLMRRFKRDMWKAGIVIAGMPLLLVFMMWLSVPAAGAQERASGSATPGTVTVQATPTEDATVTALNKEKLMQEVQQLQQSNNRGLGNWLWSNAATVLSSFLSTLVVVIGALIGFRQWSVSRKDTQEKEADARKASQTKELEDHKAEREKRAEERFQATVIGLGNEREEAKISAAILLRTFLRPDHEQFYTQTFDLAVAHLRIPRTHRGVLIKDYQPLGTGNALPLTTLSQALIVAFKESFPLARKRMKEEDPHFNPQSLDASDSQLDKANLNYADLEQAWMPGASLREANLFKANLIGANLAGANLSRANLIEAKLNSKETSLNGANLSGANLNKADLSQAYLIGTDLSQAYLSEANFSKVSLLGANLGGADLGGANLSQADLTQANLIESRLFGANLSESHLNGTDLSNSDLRYANLGKAFLADANLSGADLSSASLFDTATSLERADLRGVKGLTKEQLKAYKAKGAIIDEFSMTSSSQSPDSPSPPSQSDNTQAPSTPPAQESTPTRDLEPNNTVNNGSTAEND